MLAGPESQGYAPSYRQEGVADANSQKLIIQWPSNGHSKLRSRLDT